MESQTLCKGPIGWMVGNGVTANLLMVFLLVGGLVVSTKIKKEVFPVFEMDSITIQVSYPGASPEEVEQGILLVVEEAVQSIKGIDELTATASEGSGRVVAELLDSADRQETLQEVKQEIDRITTFPDETEEPVVFLASHKLEVLQLNIFGDVSEWALRELGEQTRDRLLQQDEISQVDIVGARDFEILVEISQDRLRAYNLTLAEVASIINAASVELPGGEIETSSGEMLLRVRDRHDWADEFSRIPVIKTDDGTVVTLGMMGEVREGFEDSDTIVTFNGKPTIALDVYRVGSQTPLGVSEAVHDAMEDIERDYPEAISWAVSRDKSHAYKQRLELLLKNAFIGLILVLCLLGLFLDFKLAFWITMGIPVSFLGGLLFMSFFEASSINMISMFAFIVALGIVVDDAIIAGENIYEYRQKNMSYIQAAVLGARDVAVPISFSILTNIAAFCPIFLVPGVLGKIWKIIPIVVITVFIISWVEALFILPSHLAHSKGEPSSGIAVSFYRQQQKISKGLVRFINGVYGPFLGFCLRWRYLAVAIGITLLVVVFTWVSSGRIGFIFMPRVEGDRSVVTAILPYGSPIDKAVVVRDKLVRSLEQVTEENGGTDLVTGVFTHISGNEVRVTAYLAAPDIRTISTRAMTMAWRKKTGPLAGLQSLRFQFDRGGPGSGKGLSVELSHRDIGVLDRAGTALAEKLSEFPQIKDVDDGFNPGKVQLDFKITSEGESLGLTAAEIARQIRNSYQGATPIKQQRGRNEVTVRVRLPETERISEYNVESMLIKTPGDTFVPLCHVTEMKRGRAYTSIDRRDGRRVITVSASIEPIGATAMVSAALKDSILPELLDQFPGLSYGFRGRQADRKKSMQVLQQGALGALILIYFLLAIPLKSYTQPVVVMASIPFGVVGAVLGHLIMGYNLSVISVMGIIALSGVLVNDSLVLIDFANKQMAKGVRPLTAVHAAGIRRFRPIILTTLTTFGGLSPMIFESSRQARFMIPMALSLGYGIIFATAIVLIIAPCLFMIVDDVVGFEKNRVVLEEEGAGHAVSS
ncbi:MAG: cobalt-zinc-cadmium resistance protein [Desulfobulbus propionicus]|nr:MAG: cobalt-zinc-cadmium resistance protein [Desulfobulbus propionicus]